MIHEGPYLNPVDQLRDSAHVVSVIVGNQDVVDLFESGLMSGSEDAIGVTTFVTGPPRVDQQRLSGGAYHQRGLSPFDIHKVEPQRLTCFYCLYRKTGLEKTQ